MNACERAGREMHRRLDRDSAADGGTGPRDEILERHLRTCGPCREKHEELRALHEALRGLGAPGLGDGARREILRLTVDADPAGAPPASSWRVPPRLVALAASLLLFASAVLIVRSPPAGGHLVARSADVERAADEVRLVLGLTSDAIDRSRDRAVREILDGELRPALRRVPILGGAGVTRPQGAPGREGSS